MCSPRGVSRAENVAADAGSAAFGIPQLTVAPISAIRLCASSNCAFIRYLPLSNQPWSRKARGDVKLARAALPTEERYAGELHRRDHQGQGYAGARRPRQQAKDKRDAAGRLGTPPTHLRARQDDRRHCPRGVADLLCLRVGVALNLKS